MSDVSFIIDYAEQGFENYGRVYQGGGPDIAMGFDNSRNRMLIQMARDIGGLQTKRDQAVVFMGIDDGPSGVLPDTILVSMAGFFRTWLSQGNDCIFGCFWGRSRSTYMNSATMMLITGWNTDKCIGFIGGMRPNIAPMQCFIDQLKRLEPVLTGVR